MQVYAGVEVRISENDLYEQQQQQQNGFQVSSVAAGLEAKIMSSALP